MATITTGCSGFAEVIIETTPPAMCGIGIYTLNPELCGPWVWLTSNPAYKEIAKKATKLGCDIVVQAGPTYYKIMLRETQKKTRHVKDTYRALTTRNGIMWLIQKLQGY